MSSYRKIIYHIVFGTYKRERTITDEHSEKLYKYIWGIVQNKNCHLYRINGVEDHIHILSDLHPTVALSDFVKDIKLGSSTFLKNNSLFPHFNGWAEGYAAFTYSVNELDTVVNYIKNQKEHHKRESYQDECKKLFKEHGIQFDDKYLP
jgi:putative transposase